MMKQKLFFPNIILLICLFFISGCENPVKYYGYELIDDFDNPYAEIKEVSHLSANDPDYKIEYLASDAAGIDKIQLYVNGEYADEENNYSGLFMWHMEGYTDDLVFQLKVYDRLGKSSYSNEYLVPLDHLEFQIIALNEYNNIRYLKIFDNDSVWLSSWDRLYQYSGIGFEELTVPGEGTINDFYLASNGDLYVSKGGYVLYRLHNNEWDQISCDYGSFYYIVETSEGNIYAKIADNYHNRIVRILDDGLEYVYIAPFATELYQVGINHLGKLCFSDEEGLKIYDNDEWILSNPGENMRCFLFGDNGDFYYYISEYADVFFMNGTEYHLENNEIEDTAFDPERGLWIMSGEVLFDDGDFRYILKENFTNLPDVEFQQVEVNSYGDVYFLSDDHLIILPEQNFQGL